MDSQNQGTANVFWPQLSQSLFYNVAVWSLIQILICLPDSVTSILGTTEECAKEGCMGTQQLPTVVTCIF